MTEGWVYSAEESSIHGMTQHQAVDFGLPVGTPVLAAASGWAVASYHGVFLYDKGTGASQRKRLYKSEPLTAGLGLFVQIYHPEANTFCQYGHLSKVESRIPFNSPVEENGEWIPGGHTIPVDEYQAKGCWVNQGDKIGEVGVTGLTVGRPDYPDCLNAVRYESWDEPHLHLYTFKRTKGQTRSQKFDPYNIYRDYRCYPDSVRSSDLWSERRSSTLTLWMLDGQGLPRFADE
ncbi:MAG TPA: M23 family metallopeptidase [Candidatus Saccharimonadales bacterium]|nr:M23 family metallopeptidase [Candidatus Saccharimonadales bacterium]